MANFPKMKLTNAGLELLANVQAGADTLTFTKTVLGDGENETPIAILHNLVSPKIEIAITEGKQVGTSTYQIGAFFSNKDIATGFWWREIGVFAKGNDGNEILYCYSNAGNAGDYIPVGNDERVEKYIYQSLVIGNAENVTAEIDETDSFILKTDKGKAGGIAPLGADGKVGAEYLPKMDYASTAEVVKIKSDLTTHLAATNPHNITAATVGLDKVPNVATNDQTPTYSETSTLTNLTSGEKLGIAFSKIKKAITDLISHLGNTTLHITATERTTWNGKAPTFHSSTETIYGIGGATKYGHLALTDAVESVASVDSGLAATPKAVKTVYDRAKQGGYTLLKTQSINTGNVYYTSGYGIKCIQITGVDFSKYDDVLLCFEGKVITTASGNGTGGDRFSTTLKFVPSATGHTTYVRDQAGANCTCSLDSGASITFDNIRFLQTLKNHPHYGADNPNGVFTNYSVKKYTTINSTYNGGSFKEEAWNTDDVYFGLFVCTGNDKLYSSATGTVYIYGKEKVF